VNRPPSPLNMLLSRHTRRREFIALLGSGAAAVWPLTVRAQQTGRIRTVGILLGSTDNPEVRRLLDAFMESFKLLGWTEDRNVRFDIRWTGGSPQSNAVQAQELVNQRPDVIFAAPSNVVIALQKETHSNTDRVRECVRPNCTGGGRQPGAPD
jgi:putative ABC transport system substrate-binding protein